MTTKPMVARAGRARSGRRSQGRPREARIDEAILSAALGTLAERGYRGMSIPAVAEAAGVTRPTIYLRFRSKFELALAAVMTLAPIGEPPDTGSTRSDLIVLARRMESMIDRTRLSLLGTMLVEEADHPELLERGRQQVVRPVLDVLALVIRRGIERGQVRADADVEAAAHLLLGADLSHYLLDGDRDPLWAERLVSVAWRSLEPANRVKPAGRSSRG